MVFSSIPFLFFFLPICFIAYFIVPKKWKNSCLLIFSLLFYAWGEPIYILLMIFSSVVDYINGRLIEKYRNTKKAKMFLVFSILVNLGLLGFFKYSDFLIQNINSIFSLNIPLLSLGLPIGISFFTFQTMSYSIDVYRNEVKPDHNFFRFMTYVSMFPQLIAGPIVRYETVQQELFERSITWKKFTDGMIRFLQGLFKKVLIANLVGSLFTTLSLEYQTISGASAWLGLFAFSFQIYFDFSGYSDMAIGLGKMMGFTYLENFNYPYIAKSITDFWRRWHISLSTWFRDYLYIPLGGSRCSKFMQIRNILIVWLATGIWHGASWNFLLWGLYYGVLLILEKFVLEKVLSHLPNYIRHILTLFLVLLGWCLFAFDDFQILGIYFSKLFQFSNFFDKQFLFLLSNYFVIFLLAALFSTPIYAKFKDKLERRKRPILSIIVLCGYLLLFFITICLLVSDTYNPFLYFRF